MNKAMFFNDYREMIKKKSAAFNFGLAKQITGKLLNLEIIATHCNFVFGPATNQTIGKLLQLFQLHFSPTDFDLISLIPLIHWLIRLIE